MTLWLAILLVALVVFLERASFILLLSRWEMPDWFISALRFVPVAVFPALIAPQFFLADGVFDLSQTYIRIIGGIAATLVAWRTKSLLATIASGMLTYWLVQFLLV